jgi:hypothetical protein
MQTIHLTFYQRVMLCSHIGSLEVERLREAAVYLRILEKIRLTDQEITETQFMAETQFRELPPRYSWRLPESDYGSRTVELEDEEVLALAGTIEQIKGVRVSDAEWMLRMVEDCTSTSAP